MPCPQFRGVAFHSARCVAMLFTGPVNLSRSRKPHAPKEEQQQPDDCKTNAACVNHVVIGVICWIVRNGSAGNFSADHAHDWTDNDRSA